MTHMTEKEARAILGDRYPGPPKRHKYNARKTTVDGLTFDSQKEADYYCQLKIRVLAGEVENFELQPEFVLQEEFIRDGRKYAPIIYRADFKLIYPDGREEIVDVKGHKTREYRMKKKMLMARYPDLWFTEVE